MRARALALALLAATATATAHGARAETIVMSLSSDTIPINSNFTGAELAVFGSIERDAATVSRAQAYDVVVTVRGPRGQVVVREKSRFGPLWLNLDQRKYIAIPAFISILSNRPLAKIAPPATLKKLKLGVESLVTEQGRRGGGVDVEEPDFRAALARLRRSEGLFIDDGAGVVFLTPTLFKATLLLPGGVPLGRYDVEVDVLAGTMPLARATNGFTVRKGGFEQRVASASRETPVAYGLATALMAMFMGWLATVIFRRD